MLATAFSCAAAGTASRANYLKDTLLTEHDDVERQQQTTPEHWVVLVFAFFAGLNVTLLTLSLVGALWTGRLILPPDFRTMLFQGAAAIVLALLPKVVQIINRWGREEQTAQIFNRIAETEHRMKNGLGDAVGEKVADKVVEKLQNGGNGGQH